MLASLQLASCGDSFSSQGTEQGAAGTDAAGAAGSAAAGAAGSGGDSGASSSSAGSAGAPSDGGAGAGGSGATGGSGGQPARCPSGRGPEMIEADGFCIDTTEVTNAHYAEFLADGSFVAHPPEECDWNDTFVQGRDGPTDANANYPVIRMDWCDAHAFCEWAGKRLCGRIGGGATPWTAYGEEDESEWFSACSQRGAAIYPYGDEYDEFKCSGRDAGGPFAPPVPVDEFAGCVGGYDGLLHMSGNAWEWVNSCGGFPMGCRVRGGSSTSDSDALRCDAPAAFARDAQDLWVSIRCCAD
jgi:formylglycine-generating enzyme